jgi:aryl-alcohol dehydrogenase-like predicted oxidoreductase
MYLIHEPDPTTPLEETLSALDDLVHQGKVRYIGASQMPAWLMVKGLWISDKRHQYRFDWVQNSYSLLDRADEREMFPVCADQKLGYTPFSPLAGGLLTGKYRLADEYPADSRMTLRPEPYLRYWNKATFDGLERFKTEARQRNLSPAGLALAWVMSSPFVTAAIVGPRKPEHFLPVQEALATHLNLDEREQIVKLLTVTDEID